VYVGWGILDEQAFARVEGITVFNDFKRNFICISPFDGIFKITNDNMVFFRGSFYGMKSDVNKTLTTVASSAKKDHVIVGDFENAVNVLLTSDFIP